MGVYLHNLYTRIYALPIWTVLLAVIALLFLWGYLRLRLSKKRFMMLNALVLLIEFLTIVYICLLRSGNSYGVYLRPFYKLVLAKQNVEYYREALMNTALFLPIGLAVSGLVSKKKTWKQVLLSILVGFFVSTSVETLQYVFSLGTVEIDDVLLDTIGASIGTLHLPISKLLYPLFGNEIELGGIQ